MDRYSNLICSIFVLLALISLGDAIQCYKCSGNITEDCGHPTEHSVFITNCTAEHNACITEVINIQNTTKEVIRGCGTKGSCDTKSSLHTITCDYCTEDFCNASSNLLPTLLGTLILFGLVRFFI